MQCSTNKQKFYPGLDAIRGIAILSVLLSHYYRSNIIFRFGWIGVDLFFVLSGFLITQLLLPFLENKNYYGYFYFNRFLRIFPAYYLTLFVALFCAFYFTNAESLTHFRKNFISYFLYLQNWVFTFRGVPSENPLNHLWSLSVEEQFYLIWPLLLKTFGRKKLRTFLWISMALIPIGRSIIYLSYPDSYGAYYCNTFTRLDTLFWGCLIGLGVRFDSWNSKVKKALIYAAIVLLISGIFYYRETDFMSPFFATIGYSIIAFLFAQFLFYFIFNDGLVWLKKNAILNYIGKISYSMYLYHLPISYLTGQSIILKKSLVPLGLLNLLITTGCATISYFCFERYFLRLKKRYS